MLKKLFFAINFCFLCCVFSLHAMLAEKSMSEKLLEMAATISLGPLKTPDSERAEFDGEDQGQHLGWLARMSGQVTIGVRSQLRTSQGMRMFVSQLKKELQRGVVEGMERSLDGELKDEFEEELKRKYLGVESDEKLGVAVKFYLRTVSRTVGREVRKEFEKSTENLERRFDENAIKFERRVDEKFTNFRRYMEQDAVIRILLGVTGAAFVWYGARIVASYIDRKLQKPRIIMDSSQKSWLKRVEQWWSGRREKEETMILSPELERELKGLFDTVSNTRRWIKEGKFGMVYSHTLLHGSPGTGKTTCAKKLAKQSGMEFLHVTGPAFFQENAKMPAMDEVFLRAESYKNGCIILIDEIDPLVPDRSKIPADSESYRFLTHFLNHMYSNDRYLIIGTTNRPDLLDKAAKSRFTTSIKMPLPEENERFRALQYYRDTFLYDEANDPKFVNSAKRCVTDEKLRNMAQWMPGADYRKIEAAISWLRTRALITKGGVITDKLVDEGGVITDELVDEMVERYQNKEEKALL